MKQKLLALTFCLLPFTQAQALGPEALLDIQHDWAKANYATTGEKQEAAFSKLTDTLEKQLQHDPNDQQARVWLAIVKSSDAGATGGLGALGKVKESRKLLEQVEAATPDILDGSVYTSLGSLYYQVPGWPIAFGNDEKAEEYLKKALEINPQGIDANYFYGDFLLEQKRGEEALKFLARALSAPDRPNRPLADKGRRDEINKAIEKAKDMQKKDSDLF